MSLKMPEPWPHPKTRTFYLRVIVPADLREEAKGQPLTVTVDGKPRRIKIGSHAKISLGTKDAAEAKRRFVEPLAALEAFWRVLRHGPVTLETTQRRNIANEVFQTLLAENSDGTADPDHWADHRKLMEKALSRDLTADQRLSMLDLLAGTLADDALAERGLSITTESRNDLLFDVGRAMRDAFSNFEAKAIIEDSERRYPKANRPAPLTAETLLAEWAAERTPAASTLKSYKGKFGQLELVLGFDDIRSVTPDHVVQFKAARLLAGKNPGTVKDDILNMGAVCNWAVTNRKLASNPFAGLAPKPNRGGEPARAPFSDDEAVRLLLAARNETDWKRWLPWILCFTGARISEIVELRRQDVRERDGVMILDIVPLAVRLGKNSIAQRMIPIHPALIAEGLLNYVNALPSDLSGPLFPSITPDQRGSRVHPATVQSGRWVRDVVGISDPQKAPNHSWRHRLEDELRKIRSLTELQDAITGRNNPRNSGAGYGKGFRGMPDEVLKDLRRVPSPVSPLGAIRSDDGERNAVTADSLITPAAASS